MNRSTVLAAALASRLLAACSASESTRDAHDAGFFRPADAAGATPDGSADAAGLAHAEPIGTWYLDASGERLALVLSSAADGLRATITEERSSDTFAVEQLRWDAVTQRLRFVVRRPTETDWFLADVTDGVLVGRFARGDDTPPDATLYVEHVTGWNAAVADRDVVPRVYEMRLADGRSARLRIDRARPGAPFVGTFKVYTTDGHGANGEADELDLHAITWDGTTLGFTVTDNGATWRYTGAARGRLLDGAATSPGCACTVTFSATRGEVLGHGLVPRPTTARGVWQARARRQLERLFMAGHPRPTSTRVTALNTDLPPIPLALAPPERDDDLLAPQSYTLTELEFEHTIADPRGGPDIVRRAHAYLARPTAPPPPGGYAVALAVNGHWGSAHDVMNPSTIYWYGDGFARRMHIVIAVDISHRPLAERGGLYTDMPDGDNPGVGNGVHPAIASEGFDSDWSEDGERAWDAMRALDYALALPDVNPGRVIVTGLSMGGEVATLVGALDPRVTDVVAAGFSPDLSEMLARGNHPCWRMAHADLREYVDTSDYHALIAPRLLVVETGKSDQTYSLFWAPFASDKQVLRRSRAAFNDAPRQLVHYLHDGAHTYRVGAPERDSTLPRGIAVPLLTHPTAADSLAWQTDAETIQLHASVFTLTP